MIASPDAAGRREGESLQSVALHKRRSIRRSGGAALRLYSHSAFNVLEHVRGRDVQGIAKSEDHPQAWTVAPKLDQGHIVAVNISP